VCNCPLASIVTTKGSTDWVNPEMKISPELPIFILLIPSVDKNNSSSIE